MKKIKLTFILLAVILFTITCKKEHVTTPVTATPVFYFNGMFDGVSTSFNAGINNYYMYSSYTQDTNHVYNFIGDLKETNSTINSIQIQINDYKVSAVNGATNIDSSLAVGYYQYDIPAGTGTVTSSGYKVYFKATTANATPLNYVWNFGDGQTYTVTTPNTTHTYTTLGIYGSQLTVNYTNGCSSNAYQYVRCNSNGLSFKASSTYSADSLNHIFNFSSVATQPYSAKWDFGDGQTSSSLSPTHTYTSSSLYSVSLAAINSSNTSDTDKVLLNIAANGYTSCISNYTDSVTFITSTVTSSPLSKIIVSYTDALGIVYSSKNIVQSTSSSFQILSVDNYQNNINNQTTKKLHIKFTCTVSNGTTSKIITNADAIIAVAYK